jgi:hypothetical protein
MAEEGKFLVGDLPNALDDHPKLIKLQADQATSSST